jgi:hypothetical protein
MLDQDGKQKAEALKAVIDVIKEAYPHKPEEQRQLIERIVTVNI